MNSFKNYVYLSSTTLSFLHLKPTHPRSRSFPAGVSDVLTFLQVYYSATSMALLRRMSLAGPGTHLGGREEASSWSSESWNPRVLSCWCTSNIALHKGCLLCSQCAPSLLKGLTIQPTGHHSAYKNTHEPCHLEDIDKMSVLCGSLQLDRDTYSRTVYLRKHFILDLLHT